MKKLLAHGQWKTDQIQNIVSSIYLGFTTILYVLGPYTGAKCGYG